MYSLGDAAPVNNPGYFDVPIHNELSNPIREGKYIETSNYSFNNDISNTINNAQNYLINQTPGPGNPSPSLYYEQDQTMSGYEYPNEMNEYKKVLRQKQNFYKKQIPDPYQSYQLEDFQNQGSGPPQGQAPKPPVQATNRNQMAGRPQMPNNVANVQPQVRPSTNRNPPNRPMNKPNIVNSQNEVKPTNRPIKEHRGRHRPYHNHHNRPEKVVYNNYIPYSRPDSTYYYDYIPRFVPNNYLNIGSIPNIAGFYSNLNNIPIVEDTVYNNPVVERPILEDVIEDTIDDKEIIVNENNTTKESQNKSRSMKKKKTKKKSNLIYLVLFLLLIVIIMMLYIIFKNQKRVRF